VLVGLTPWNYIACNAGVILSSFKNKDEIIQPENYIFLVVLSVIFFLSFLIGKKNKNKNE